MQAMYLITVELTQHENHSTYVIIYLKHKTQLIFTITIVIL